MTEATKRHFTNLVEKWAALADKERVYGLNAKKISDQLAGEAAWGRREAFQRCANDLSRLLDQCGD